MTIADQRLMVMDVQKIQLVCMYIQTMNGVVYIAVQPHMAMAVCRLQPESTFMVTGQISASIAGRQLSAKAASIAAADTKNKNSLIMGIVATHCCSAA